MQLFRLKLFRCNRRKWRIVSLIFVTIFNFAFGLFLISSVISIAENKRTTTEEPMFKEIEQESMEEITQITTATKSTTSVTRKPRKPQYDYYFRIDLTIVQSVCKPLELFNSTTNLISLEEFTSSKIQTVFTPNTTIKIEIFSLNPILTKTDKIQKSVLHRTGKTVCDYLLQLSVGLDFTSFCNDECKFKEIRLLTTQTRPFQNKKDQDFSFTFHSGNRDDSIVKYNVDHVFVYQTSIFLDTLVYIRSFHEVRYVSALILDPDGLQSSITMSQIERTPFIVKDGIEQNLYNVDSSVIFISFLSTTLKNTYLRHESARIKLGKNDESPLFKNDATFKLLFGNTRKDVIAFEAVNLPQYYIGVDPESQTALILAKPEKLYPDVELLDKRFLFKLVFNE